jgi:multiple sugar transport system substrate-binding protein
MTTTKISRRSLVKGATASAAVAAAGTLTVGTPLRASAASTTLTFLRHTDPPANNLEKKLIQQYEQANPTIKINYVNVPDANLFTKYESMVVGGASLDLFNLGSSDFPAIIARNQAAPIDLQAVGVASMAELEGQFLPNALTGYTFEGKLYALPHELSDYVMWVNTAMLSKAGVEYPKTWEELLEIAPKLMIERSGKVVQEAIALPQHFPGGQFLVFDAMVRQAGGQLFSDDGKKSFLSSDPAIKAAAMLASLAKNKTATDPALNGTTATADRDLFQNGVAAMMVTGGSWYRGTLATSKVGQNAIPVPYPRFKGGPDVAGDLYGYGIAVSAHSKHQTEAWKFVAYLTSHGADYFETEGLFIGDKATSEGSVAAKYPHWSTFQNELARGHYQPLLVHGNEISDIVGRTLDTVILSNQDPKSALSAAESQVTPLLNS